MNLYNEANVNDGMSPRFSADDITNNPNNTDFQKETFTQNAPMTNHTIQISGGNDKSIFNMSVGYLNQQGIIGSEKSQFKKYTFRLNSEHKLNKYVKVGENLFYSTQKTAGISNQHGMVGVLSTAIMTEPNIPLYATDPALVESYDNLPAPPVRDPKTGEYYHLAEFTRNPLAWLESTFNEGIGNGLSGNAYLEVADVIEGLKFRSDVALYIGNGYGRGYSPIAYYSPADINYNRIVNQSGSQSLNLQWENTLSYSKSFGDHNTNVLVGTSIQKNSGSWLSGSRNNNIPEGWDNAWLNNGANDDTQKNGGAYWENRMQSNFGRVDYNYQEKYMFMATLRADGSSRFGPNNKYGYFPSVSAGWNVSRESFFNSLGIIDLLKLRASWGQVGNDAIGDFSYMPSVVNGYTYVLGVDGIPQQSIIPGAASNSGLKWETSEQTNFGLDLEILNSRVVFNAEYYIKNTKDLLSTSPIPLYVGVGSPLGNLGEISNKGIELALTLRERKNDFSYSVTMLVSHNNNEVVEVANEDGYINGSTIDKQISGNLRMEEGFAYPYFYGYKTDGIFQNQAEIDAYSYVDENNNTLLIQPDARPGDIKFVDIDGDGAIAEGDRTNIGNAIPDWTYGLNFDFSYRNFDFSFLLQGQSGSHLANVTYINSQNYSVRGVDALDRWTEDNPTNDRPLATFTDLNGNYSKLNDMVHVEKADFLRIKNMQLGYTFSENLLKSVGISKARIYVSAQNVFTLTNYSGFDPEIGTGYGYQMYMDYGIDRAAYPQSRIITTGLSLTF